MPKDNLSKSKNILKINLRNFEKILKLATTFRKGLERNKHILTLPTLENFPKGSCGDASLLLAKFLNENGCGSFDYVLGQRNNHSHAWLEQGDLIIDITADQFNDNKNPVIVTTDNYWHKQFNGRIEHIADINRYDDHTKSTLFGIYKKLT